MLFAYFRVTGYVGLTRMQLIYFQIWESVSEAASVGRPGSKSVAFSLPRLSEIAWPRTICTLGHWYALYLETPPRARACISHLISSFLSLCDKLKFLFDMFGHL